MTTKKVFGFFIGLVGILGLSLLAICSGSLLSVSKMDASVSPKIDALLVAIEKDQAGPAYVTQTSNDLKKVVTQEQFISMAKAINLRLGKLKKKVLRGVIKKHRNLDTYMDVTYAADFAKGKGTIRATLKKEDGNWRFVAFQVNSPAFEQDIVNQECPSCRKPHSSTARFCPSCGASLPSASEAGPDVP
jgi:hypothetical protein